MRLSSGMKITAIATAIAAALFCLLSSVSCQKKMPERLDGMYSSDTASSVPSESTATKPSGEKDSDSADSSTGKTTATASEGKAKDYSAPQFKSGRYTMESSSVSEQHFYSGKSEVSFTRVSQIYTYDVRLTVAKNGSMKAVYTFRRIRTGYETEEGALVTDTNEKSGRDEDNSVYYDLIGQSFTVKVSKDYGISVSGIDVIHKKFPYTADVVTDDNMKDVVSDLFYPIDARLRQGSSWKLKQVGLNNTYTVSSVKSGNVYVNIKGEQLELPEPFTNNGVKYTYKKREPLTGSLVISLDNRMIQEQSSYQENSGVIESGGKKYTFSESAASVCTIKK